MLRLLQGIALSAGAAAALCLLSVCTAAPAAGSAAAGISEGFRFDEKEGESLYRAVCQSCHMPQGQGARGAGAYPALAANPRLASRPYLVETVLNGRGGMPSFRPLLSDEQIVEVANYVRTHMGNDQADMVTVGDVKSLR